MELGQFNMDGYEKKKAIIAAREKEIEKERLEKKKGRDLDYQKRLIEQEKKKEDSARELDELKERKFLELDRRERLIKIQNDEKKRSLQI